MGLRLLLIEPVPTSRSQNPLAVVGEARAPVTLLVLLALAGYRSVAELARVAGLHRTTVNLLILGARIPVPRRRTVRRLSAALRRSDEDVLDAIEASRAQYVARESERLARAERRRMSAAYRAGRA